MDWKDEGPEFNALLLEFANLQADYILERNAEDNLIIVNNHLTSIKQRVLLEEEFGDDRSIIAFKALGFSFYRLKEAYESMLIERN